MGPSKPVDLSMSPYLTWVTQDQLVIGFSLLIGILILAVVLRKWFSGARGARGNTVLLVGLCNVGKTVLFLQLRDGKFRTTQTSMKENRDTFEVHSNHAKEGKRKKTITVVDVPGHQRLRSTLHDFLPTARSLVLVVDAVDFAEQTRPTAELLYDLLTNKNVTARKLPILIACNKKDLMTAVSNDYIKTQLEKEIDKLRITRKSVLDQGQDEASEDHLGIEGESFKMEQLELEISFTDCSAKDGDIKDVVEFIN